MTYTIAIVADPWLARLTAANQQLEKKLESIIQQLPVATQILTATSRHQSYNIWRRFNYSGSIHYGCKVKNSMLMSKQWEHSKYDPKTKTYNYSITLGARLVLTRDGLVNTNAEYDAITRMLSTKKPKPDMVLIIDPEQLITTGSISQHTASLGIFHAHKIASQMGLNTHVIP